MMWLFSLLGGLIVLVVLRDIFHTLLHPSGHGRLSRAVMRGVWWVARRSGQLGMGLAGPLTMITVITTWGVLLVLGWALIYLEQYTETYYFHDGPSTSLASVLAATVSLAEANAAADDAERQMAGTVLLGAVDELTGVLDAQYLETQGDRGEVIAAYRRDHRQ